MTGGKTLSVNFPQRADQGVAMLLADRAIGVAVATAQGRRAGGESSSFSWIPLPVACTPAVRERIARRRASCGEGDADEKEAPGDFTTSRGVEALGSVRTFLDLTPLGRQENWEDSPAGYPQTKPYEWWRRHDEYEDKSAD